MFSSTALLFTGNKENENSQLYGKSGKKSCLTASKMRQSSQSFALQHLCRHPAAGQSCLILRGQGRKQNYRESLGSTAGEDTPSLADMDGLSSC